MNKDALLLHADATHIPLPAGRIQLAIEDGPYAVMNHEDLSRGPKMKAINRSEEWDMLDKYEWAGLMSAHMRELYRVCDKGATAYQFCAHEMLGTLRDIGEFNGWSYKMPIAWHKTNPAPRVHLTAYQASIETIAMFVKGKGNTFNAENGGKIHNMLEYPAPSGRERLGHGTQKSLDLIVQLILMSSNPGDLVLDSFMGTGVCGKAALITRRRFIGGDLKYTYVRDMAAWKVQGHASAEQAKDTPLFAGVM